MASSMEAIDGDEAAAVLGSDAILTETQDVDLYAPGTTGDGSEAAGEASSSKGSDATPGSTTAAAASSKSFEEDLVVVIKDPTKHTEGNLIQTTYVTYTIVTKTKGENVASFGFEEATVLRRYTDFLWLREQMVREYPGHIIPPMPPKHSTERNKASDRFLEIRRVALQRFVKRLAKHPVLNFSKTFRIFLSAKAHELITAKKEREVSFMDSLTQSAMVLQIKLMTKPPSDERFIAMRDHNLAIEAVYKQMETTCTQSIKSITELTSVATDFSAALLKLGETEAALSPFLMAMKEAFSKQIGYLETSKSAWQLEILEPSKEYISYAESIRDVLRRRDNVEREYHVMIQLLKEKQAEEESVSADDQKTSVAAVMGKQPEDVKKLKLEKIAGELEELKESMERCQDYTEVTNTTIGADMDRWHEDKNLDLLAMIEGLADSQIEYSKGMISAWNATLELDA